MVLPLHQRDARYQDSRVYRLVHPTRPEIYVGSTIGTLDKRLRVHRCAARREANRGSPLYKLMNATGIEQWQIELVREVACWTRAELETVELEEAQRVPEMLRLNVADRPGWAPEQTPAVLAKRVATKALHPGRVHAVGSLFVAVCGARVCASRLGSRGNMSAWSIGRRTRQQAIDLAKEYIERRAMADADVPEPVPTQA